MAVVNQILTPAQQNSLAIQGINIQNLQKELDNVTQEITTIYSTISEGTRQCNPGDNDNIFNYIRRKDKCPNANIMMQKSQLLKFCKNKKKRQAKIFK